MLPTPIRVALYPVFALFCLALFLFVLFPFESLKSRVAAELEQGLGGQYTVSIAKVGPAPLTGVSLKNVKIQPRKPGPEIELDRMRLKVSLLPLLWGSREIDLRVKKGKGVLSGRLLLKSEETRLDLEFDELDLSLGRLALPAGIPVAGRAHGRIELQMFPADPLRNSGRVDCEIEELRIEEGGNLMGFPMPGVTLAGAGKSPSRVEIDVVRGNWEVRKIDLMGGEIEFAATGKVYAARKAENYRMNLKGSFQASPAAEEKLPFFPLIQNQKTEGKYPFFITGRLSRPSIRIGEFKVPI